ncbi:hypothetical protein C5C07_19180 [Haloferax sp. Atlit-4N]|uniref:hypothetical protein n=1 Tax=Haloferax sp. Atlit-4N TaxID=2077206 RepID=UPI000E24911F|nr:hypothetical protein [Haloferax sp. Atlit-4N]RDZ50447.1 hypothetical protein C5C07_19180 [Haloferax sp. Atlit-4N]
MARANTRAHDTSETRTSSTSDVSVATTGFDFVDSLCLFIWLYLCLVYQTYCRPELTRSQLLLTPIVVFAIVLGVVLGFDVVSNLWVVVVTLLVSELLAAGEADEEV